MIVRILQFAFFKHKKEGTCLWIMQIVAEAMQKIAERLDWVDKKTMVC